MSWEPSLDDHRILVHGVTVRRRPNGPRVAENPRPPRYRLLTAAAALPQREAVHPNESFERACPACERVVIFTQIHNAEGIEYSVEVHDCREIGA